MRCAEARDLLMHTDGAGLPPGGGSQNSVDPRSTAAVSSHARATLPPALATHLESCRDCAAFGERLASYRSALPSLHTGVDPGPDFSARVVAHLPDTVELLGWASLRLLPAALALALLCSWYGLTHGPGLSDLLLAPGDPALITYVAPGPGEGP
jgi:hypothetical protein